MTTVKGLALLIRTPEGERPAFTVSKLITRIGRDDSNDLMIPVSSVSRKHAALIIDRGGPQRLYIEDLRSQNGTRVNGQIVNDIAPVQIGDVITLAEDVTLTLQEDHSHQG